MPARSNCIAGSLLDSEWAPLLEADVYSGSKHESDAREFDTRGVTVFARKPAS